MEVENFFSSGHIESKRFNQQDITTAGAAGLAVDDETEAGIDLNEQLIRNRPATYFMRVSGSSMINAGIFDGDIVIVDRSIEPKSGKIVIAVIDGEMLIRRLDRSLNKMRLIPETTRLAAIDVSEFSNYKIWGVVVYVIRNVG